MPSVYHIRIQTDGRIKSNFSNQKRQSDIYTASSLPRNLFDALPAHTALPISKRRDTETAKKDYRYGPIRIDWIDFIDTDSQGENMASNASGSALNKVASDEWRSPIAIFKPSYTMKSGTSNLPDGVVHIFREKLRQNNNDTSSTQASTSTSPTTQSQSRSDDANAIPGPSNFSFGKDATAVAVLAVPERMAPSDFLAFVAPTAENMKHLRFIRDAHPNRTMAVIQFRTAESATEFLEEFNGAQYNALEPETCNVVRLSSVEVSTEDPVSATVNLPSSAHSTVYELPTCPVCLDRMDASVTGLVTVPCSHTFHCTCLSKWGDSRCPVCRYSQRALSSSSSGQSNDPTPAGVRRTTCMECDSRMNLWICLVCGNVGCGRQGRAHAKAHYELVSHPFAMELETQRVWDYAGDNYVHRLIQNKADGKLVELPSAIDDNEGGRGGGGPGADDNLKAEKVEILAMQYSQILQQVMEEQRAAHDEEVGELRRRLDDVQRKLEITVADSAREREERSEELKRLRNEVTSADKKAEQMADLARQLRKEKKKVEKELEDEKLLDKGRKERVETVEREKRELSSRVADLEDQMRDLMFFLEARDKIEAGGGAVSEAAGGSIELPPPPPNNVKTKKKKK